MQHRRGTHRWAGRKALLVVLSVVGVLGLCLGITACGSTPARSQAPERQPETTKKIDKRGPPMTPDTSESPLKVAFLGDSYVVGRGAKDQPRTRWTARVCEALGWTESNLGLAGTGYTTPGPADKATTYLQRVDAVREAAPDVVVVSGGRNDLVASVDRIRSAAVQLFTALDRIKGSPDVVVVAPLWDASDPPAEFDALTRAIKGAARQVGVTFVPVPRQPLAGRPELMSGDALHPDADGYRVIAEFLAPRLKDAVRGR